MSVITKRGPCRTLTGENTGTCAWRILYIVMTGPWRVIMWRRITASHLFLLFSPCLINILSQVTQLDITHLGSDNHLTIFGINKGEIAFGPDEAFLAPILSFLLRLSQSVDMVGQMGAFLRFQSFGQFRPFLDLWRPFWMVRVPV